MFRCFLAGLFMLGVVLATGLPDSAAQEKKAQPKKERIAIADPKEAASYTDFAIQGEYEGEAQGKDKRFKVGAQVISKGAEAFEIRVFLGGLPGDGSNRKPSAEGSGERRGKEVTLSLHRPKSDKSSKLDADKTSMRGTISGGKMVLRDGRGDVWGTLEKVHRKSKTLGAKPPEGAVVLFGKPGDESNWTNGKLMELSDGTFLTVAKTGGIKSKQAFGAFTAHIEFRTPWMPDSSGQARGNSGVYIQDRYECQVLDSFGLSGENNECGGIYTQHKPLVNMCYPPLSWQTYDIEFTPAVFEGGKKVKNARATIDHNGVKIHDDVEFPKECPGGQKEGPMPGPFQFQDHGNPVVYRNVWVVPK